MFTKAKGTLTVRKLMRNESKNLIRSSALKSSGGRRKTRRKLLELGEEVFMKPGVLRELGMEGGS